MKIRVGFGYDVHRLQEGEELKLGGVVIPHEKGTVGHSDGDVLLHAITDAVLGAINSHDIGYYFPDTDASNKNKDSSKMLEYAITLAYEKGFTTGNLDCTIVAEKPKLSEYFRDMRSRIAALLQINPDEVALKATTTEKIGFEGREEGIAVYAVILMQKNSRF